MSTADVMNELPVSLRADRVDQVLLTWPLPVADAVEALAAARSLHEARDRVVEVFRAITRLLAGYALSARMQYGPGPAPASPRVDPLIATLKRRPLTDGQWVELTRELLRPWSSDPDQHVLPALVRLFHGNRGLNALMDGLLAMRREETVAHGATGEVEDLRRLLDKRIPQLDQLLERVEPAATRLDLVLALGDGVGLRLIGPTPHRGRWRRQSVDDSVPRDQLALVDAQGRPLLSLYPVARFMAPMAGAVEELFWLEGGDRRGVRYLAIPSMAHRIEGEALAELDALLGRDDDAAEELEGEPFVGLASFGAQDQERFFGRDHEADELANRVRSHGLVVVTGASGSGKSSLLHAGVLPRLSGYLHVVVRPGLTPLRTLTRVLGEILDLPADAVSSAAPVRRHCARSGQRLVVVVDQVEEIFTLGLSDEARGAWLGLVADLGAEDAGPLHVVLSVREDFFGRLSVGPLAGRVARQVVLITPPDEAALLSTLHQPVGRLGYTFEPGLADEMVRAIAGEPAALALLQFCASQLWEARDRTWKRLNRDAYERLGGVEGALAAHAERTLATMPPARVARARQLLRRLVTTEGTRAVVERAELVHTDVDGQVVEALTAARLLVTREGEEGQALVELTHEALLRHWSRLRSWLADDQEGHRHLEALAAAAKTWRERAQDPELLWRGDRLAEAALWARRTDAVLPPDAHAFLERSVSREQQAARRRRRALVGTLAMVSAALAVMIALSYTAWVARGQAEEGRRAALEESRRARDALYAARANTWRDEDPALGGLVLQELDPLRVPAAGPLVREATRQVLPRAYRAIPRFGPTRERRFVHFGRHGQLIVGSGPGQFSIFDPELGRFRGSAYLNPRDLQPGARPPDAHLFDSPDGVLYVTIDHGTRRSGPEGVAEVDLVAWNLAEGPEPRKFGTITLPPSPSGPLPRLPVQVDDLAERFAFQDGELHVFSARTGAHHNLGPVPRSDMTFAAEGGPLATCGRDGTVTAWHVPTGDRRAVQAPSPLLGCLPRPGSQELLAVTASADFFLLDLAGDMAPRPLFSHPDGMVTAAPSISDDGRWVVSLGAGGQVVAAPLDDPEARVVTRVEGYREVSAAPDGSWWWGWDGDTLRIHSTTDAFPPVSLGVSCSGSCMRQLLTPPDARTLLVHTGEAIRTYDVPVEAWTRRARGVLKGRVGQVAEVGERLERARWSPSGTHVATSSNTRVILVDLRTGQRTTLHEGVRSNVWVGEFSPDGRWLVGRDSEVGVFVWEVASGERRVIPGPPEHDYKFATWSPRGDRLLVQARGGGIELHDATGAQPPRTLREPSVVPGERPHDPFDAYFASDGTRALTSYRGGTIATVDLTTGRVELIPGSGKDRVHLDRQTAIAGPEGLRILRPLDSTEVRVIDGRVDTFHEAVVSPDGTRVAASSHDGRITVFDLVGDAAPVSTSVGSTTASFSWSPDGQHLVIEGAPAQVWTPARGGPIPLTDRSTHIRHVTYTGDGRMLTASREGIVKLWHIDVLDAQRELTAMLEGCLSPEIRRQELAETPEEAAAAWESCERALGRDPYWGHPDAVPP